MQRIWHSIKGYLAAGIALIACPCHLPLTMPLLISLTAGTALSRWLQGNFTLVAAISTAAFLGGLLLSARWLDGGQPSHGEAVTRSKPLLLSC